MFYLCANKQTNKQAMITTSTTATATNYHKGTTASFEGISAQTGIEFMTALLKWRRLKNKPAYVVVGGQNWRNDFQSVKHNAWRRSRSASFYFVSEDGSQLVRISDHWSDTAAAAPRSQKLNCGFIRSCWWAVENANVFAQSLPGERYMSYMVAAKIAFDAMGESFTEVMIEE
jgi:hypothetical protein